jgi:signal transduction histidine kinase
MTKDLVLIIALTVATCGAVAAIGAGLLYLLRRRSLRYQLMIAALLPVMAVAGTVLIHVRLMFLSAHDSGVVLIALAIAVVLAVAAAWLVLRRVAYGGAQLGAALRQLAAESGQDPRPPAAAAAAGSAEVPAEMARLLEELATTRETLANSRARERAAEQSRRDLVSFMSHDLRTPLAGLRALAEGLEDGVIADVPRALAHLRTTVSRMTVLVDDLFALSRLRGAEESKPATLVSLTELISDVAAESTASAQAQGVQVEVTVPADDRLAVYGSSDDLARALANLTTNAIRHTDRGLTVRLEGSRGVDGHVRVAVIDGCGGIPDAQLPRVFETGWRGDPSRSGDDGGAGLGLAITRGVVESHAGQIDVHNVDGGCRFEVALPASIVGQTERL